MTINIGHLIKTTERLTGNRRNFTSAPDYAEPGYTTPKNGIVFGNWNPVCGFNVTKDIQKRDPVTKLSRILESMGCECEWGDEWTTCCDCGKAVRTSPNSYQWTPYYRILNECDLVCLDCLDPEDYLTAIEDNPNTACPPEWNPTNYGYVQYEFPGDTKETGLHPGQNDDPKALFAKMQAAGLKHVIFRIKEQSQFYVRWEIYYKVDAV